MNHRWKARTGRRSTWRPQCNAFALAAAVLLVASCHQGREPAHGSPLARALPDAAPPFTAGPPSTADGWVRRRYQRGAVAIDVTVAARPQAPGEYEQWLAQSRDYPQASLPLPPDAANGFYTCAGPGTDGGCDLHVQTRAGFHVEVLGGGHATRADLDALMARLPLAVLIESPP